MAVLCALEASVNFDFVILKRQRPKILKSNHGGYSSFFCWGTSTSCKDLRGNSETVLNKGSLLLEEDAVFDVTVRHRTTIIRVIIARINLHKMLYTIIII